MEAVLNLLFENPGPLEQSAMIVAIAIVVSVLLRFGTEAVLAHFAHKQDRRSYEYERSATVNTMRFEQELESAQALSKLFMQLRLQTHFIRVCKDEQLEEAVSEWDSTYYEAAIALGEAAPVLNLRDIAHGGPTCGVHSRDADQGDRNSRQSKSSTIKCKPSLYLRGVAFMDQAVLSRYKALASRDENAVLCMPLVLYTREGNNKKNRKFEVDSESYTSQAAAIASIIAGGGAILNQCEVSESEGFDAELGIDKDLDEAYKRFVNCSFCRLRNSDTGQKDARKINRKNAMRRWFVSRFRFLSNYDRECPFDKGKDGARSREIGFL